MDDDKTTHGQNKCVDFPKCRERLRCFIWVFINRSTVSQASKHTTSYSLAFALFHVLNVKGITIGKLTEHKNIKQKDIYILHYKYVKCTSLYISTKDGRLEWRPNLKYLKNIPEEKQNNISKYGSWGQRDCWPKTSLVCFSRRNSSSIKALR